MKRLLFILIIVPMFSMAQTVDINRLDDFTGQITKTSTWEPLYIGKIVADFRIVRIDSNYYFDLTYSRESFFTVNKSEPIYFKLKNGKVLILKNVAIEILNDSKKVTHFLYKVENGSIKEMVYYVEKIRFKSVDETLDIDIDDRKAQIIIKAIFILR